LGAKLRILLITPPNTLFVGKVLHTLLSVDSTNKYAAALLSKTKPSDGTVILAQNQTNGRGQFGTYWESAAGLNLTISIVLFPKNLKAKEQFILNQAISLGVLELIKTYTRKQVAIKWPNDIYVEKNKIAGILIENTLLGEKIEASIVGIGININEVNFADSLPNPTSLKLLLIKTLDLNQVFQRLCQSIELHYLWMINGKWKKIKSDYQEALFGIGKTLIFRQNKTEFQGAIIGVSEIGKLQIQQGDEIKEYAFKEIEWVFDSPC
jgi:BirA family biotin operon repressor/biotin-[acetyl-CoA-carboxylase] ligase